MNKSVLIIDHPHDETIGCGGTILKHINNGDTVNIITLTDEKFKRFVKSLR